MGRRTNQKHYQRKTYKDVDAWLQENDILSALSHAKVPAETVSTESETVQQVIAKAEDTNPYLVCEQQPLIFQDDGVDPLSTVTDMCYLTEFVKRRYSENARKLQLYNSRLMDLQHEIELLPPKNAPKGYRMYKDQRDILIKRRVAKDENAVLEPLKELIEKNPEVFTAMTEVLNQIEHIDKNRHARRYHYRAPELRGENANE